MKLIDLSEQIGIELFSYGGYEERWLRDKSQPRMVSAIDPEQACYDGKYAPAFFLDSEYAVGVWGAVDKNGEFLIQPQYLFAYPLKDGRMVVAKGKWEYRDNWELRGDYYAGYWYESELWGVVDASGNEIIACEHAYIDDISDEDRKGSIVKVLDNDGGVWRCELFNASTGKLLVGKDRGYSDFGDYWPEDKHGQIISAIGGSIRGWGSSENVTLGVFDLNGLEDIIVPQYGYIDIADKGLYQVGDADMYGDEKNGTVVNRQNQKILERNDIRRIWRRHNGVYELTFMDWTKGRFKMETDETGLPIRFVRVQ